MDLLLAFSVLLGVGLAIGMFVFLPQFLAGLIYEIPGADSIHPVLKSLIEGGLMLSIFLIYLILISLMKDIRRTFMYHGAEHKVINCYEYGLPLTVENARKMPKAHSRCGTTFMFFVVAVSILVFAFVNWILDLLGWLGDNNVLNTLIKLGCKLLFIPIVAGISYELLKFLAKYENPVVRALRLPGMLLQKLTTKEPTDDMLEVSLASFKAVMEMDADPLVPTVKFDIKIPYAEARKKLVAVAGKDGADIDWILTEVTGLKRSELSTLKVIRQDKFDIAEGYAKGLKEGKPLQYILGNTDFYDCKILVDGSVLIPRPETEELAEKAVRLAKTYDKPVVLDLCTGSGCIAVAIAKHTNADVTASDISKEALETATANAEWNKVSIDFRLGDLFTAVEGKTFDIIVSNPPYIPSNDIAKLDREVKDFEPMSALDGGMDGMDFYRRIAESYNEFLNDGGSLLLEFGIGQENEIKNLFPSAEIFADMQGINRMAVVKKN
jgi:release factor-specific protein-(glutamine-N5) methyltransferase